MKATPLPLAAPTNSPSHETASAVLAAQAKAVIEARYVMAERHPRDLDAVRQKLLKECRRPGFAHVARYRKPIGKGIEGPSIRFAEAAIRYMGNISVEQVTVYDDREKRIVRVSVTDCEGNVPYSSDIMIEKTIERRSKKDSDTVVRTRLNAQGDLVYIIIATEDELLNKQNALISKAIRTNGLRHVPGDIVEECMNQVLATQRDSDAADPDEAKRKIFDAFSSLGIQVSQIKELLGHEAASLTPRELADLRGLYASLRDGEVTWRDVMDSLELKSEPAEQAKSTTASVKDKLKKRSGVVDVTGDPSTAQRKDEAAGQREPGSGG